jgi:hypothetical protein
LFHLNLEGISGAFGRAQWDWLLGWERLYLQLTANGGTEVEDLSPGTTNLDLGGHIVHATVEGAYDALAVRTATNGYREVTPNDDPDAWSGGPLR